MSRSRTVSKIYGDFVEKRKCFLPLCLMPPYTGYTVELSTDRIKKRPERRKHCMLAVVRRSQKFSSRRRPPSGGHRIAKIYSAGDGHYLYLQTQFREDRCAQFRVIAVTDPQITNYTHTNKPTDRTDYNTLRC